MLLMGDEVRRTQRGNNNAYCHDDETSWFDWTLLERHCRRASLRESGSSRIAFTTWFSAAGGIRPWPIF
jgi:pullulanase/glycogen debranching enzyme